MNLEEMIKKYLGEWLDEGSKVRIEYGPNRTWCYMVSFYRTSMDMNYSTDAWCNDIEKGLEVIRERLQNS